MEIKCSLEVSTGIKYSLDELLYNINMSDENKKEYVTLLQTVTEKYGTESTIEIDSFDKIFERLQDKLKYVEKLISDAESDDGCTCEPATSFTGDFDYTIYESAIDIHITLGNNYYHTLKAYYNISTKNTDFITKLTDLCKEYKNKIAESHRGVLSLSDSSLAL